MDTGGICVLIIFRTVAGYFSKKSKNLFISDMPFDLASSNEKGMAFLRAIRMPSSLPSRSYILGDFF